MGATYSGLSCQCSEKADWTGEESIFVGQVPVDAVWTGAETVPIMREEEDEEAYKRNTMEQSWTKPTVDRNDPFVGRPSKKARHDLVNNMEEPAGVAPETMKERQASTIAAELPRPVELVPAKVPLTWETPCGEKTVYVERKPLGLQFLPCLPVQISPEQDGHGKEIGIEAGWILKNVNGIDVTGMSDFKEVMDILHTEVGEDPEPKHRQSKRVNVPLTWETPSGEKTVYATQKRLGLQFHPSLPIKISREQDGHGKDIGIELGWVLTKVNGIDVKCMTNFKDVADILQREVGVDPEPKQKECTPLQVPLTWATPSGLQTVYVSKKEPGIRFPQALPVKLSRDHKKLGMEAGWTLKEVNGIDVTDKTDFKEVMDILHKEAGFMPQPIFSRLPRPIMSASAELFETSKR